MFRSLLVILVLSIAGDALTGFCGAVIPRAAMGLACLATLFFLHGGPDAGSARLFDGAAPFFPFFFIPAAMGVIASYDLLASAWPFIALAIVGSAAAAILATGLVAQGLLGWRSERREL